MPKWPEVPEALCLEEDIKAKAIWNTAATIADQGQVTEIPDKGAYRPIYVKMWEYEDGSRISTSHFNSGRMDALGHQLPAHCRLIHPDGLPKALKSNLALYNVELVQCLLNRGKLGILQDL